MDYLSQHIESLIFTSQGPITFQELKEALEDSFEQKFKKADVQAAIQQVLDKYKSDDFAFEIIEIALGYQFFTKGAYHQTVGSRLKLTSKKRLSKAALETLAVIAYKQPVVKSELEKIRGVSCDYTIQKLLEKELIAIAGRSEGPGRPLLYTTSQKFMDYFGLKDISELPKPKDFKLPDDEIGDAAPIEELTEEQRVKRSTAIEEIADEVAAAIGGEEIFPMLPGEEVEGIEDGSRSNDLKEDGQSEDEDDKRDGLDAEKEDIEAEAAIDDEAEDMASEMLITKEVEELEEASIEEETKEKPTFYYRTESNYTPQSVESNDMVEPMAEEEIEKLLEADELLEGEIETEGVIEESLEPAEFLDDEIASQKTVITEEIVPEEIALTPGAEKLLEEELESKDSEMSSEDEAMVAQIEKELEEIMQAEKNDGVEEEEEGIRQVEELLDGKVDIRTDISSIEAEFIAEETIEVLPEDTEVTSDVEMVELIVEKEVEIKSEEEIIETEDAELLSEEEVVEPIVMQEVEAEVESEIEKQVEENAVEVVDQIDEELLATITTIAAILPEEATPVPDKKDDEQQEASPVNLDEALKKKLK